MLDQTVGQYEYGFVHGSLRAIRGVREALLPEPVQLPHSNKEVSAALYWL